MLRPEGTGRIVRVINHTEGSWSTKTNFVDEQNRVVGFDTSQHCCEHAGWFISPDEAVCVRGETEEAGSPDAEALAPYRFDGDYFVLVNDYAEFDEGGLVRFRLVAEGLPDLFLHLFNVHNGYYSHGFDADLGGPASRSGTI